MNATSIVHLNQSGDKVKIHNFFELTVFSNKKPL